MFGRMVRDQVNRRNLRLVGFDYSQAGAYFVTICSRNRDCIFGEVVGFEMKVNVLGQMVEETWREVIARFPYLRPDQFIVMPNHFHAIVNNVGAPLAGARSGDVVTTTSINPPTVGDIIGRFKSVTTFRYLRTIEKSEKCGILWQRNYYEHIIRNELVLEKIRQYIVNNPVLWEQDPDHPMNDKRC